MIKYFLTLFLPILLSASLTYFDNSDKEVAILESFDIDSSFLYDPIMNSMKNRVNREKHFFKAMSEAYIFIPSIKNILVKYKVPQEFLYLAMAESNFSNVAYSKKSASGLWQFMPKTGKLFGLKIDEYVDERRDLIKSTEAAAKYLSFLHKKFGKWYLAAIAYNCGGGKLNRAIKEAGTDELSVLLDEKKKYIPKESRYYIRKIVALAIIGNDENFLLKHEYEHLLNRASAYSIASVKVPSGKSLKRVSRLISLPLKELQELNKHLKYDFVPPYNKSYIIYIPYVKLSDFKRKYYKTATKHTYKIYNVKAGDNLSIIGKRYKVPYKVIMDFNKLKNTRLKLKQKLIIPIVNKKSDSIVNTQFIYLVKKGDTLGSISKRYKVSVNNLKLNNHLKSSLIKIGDRLKIYE